LSIDDKRIMMSDSDIGCGDAQVPPRCIIWMMLLAP
jgi:hypothetical protein